MDETPLELDLDGILTKLRAAEQRAEIAEKLLEECKSIMQAAITPEWCKDDRGDYCPSCNNYDRNGHDNDCPRQAAAEWLETHDSPK